MSDSTESDHLLLSAAEQLSAMADKVAGFAISANLLLIFACLKDLDRWVKQDAPGFYVGILSGALVYVIAVLALYYKERSTRAAAGPAFQIKEINDVSRTLVAARILGIMLFALINIMAVAAAEQGLH